MKYIFKDLIQERLDLERANGRVFDVSHIDARKDMELYEVYEAYDKTYFEDSLEGKVLVATLSDDAPEEAWEAAMLRYAWAESPYYEIIHKVLSLC